MPSLSAESLQSVTPPERHKLPPSPPKKGRVGLTQPPGTEPTLQAPRSPQTPLLRSRVGSQTKISNSPKASTRMPEAAQSLPRGILSAEPVTSHAMQMGVQLESNTATALNVTASAAPAPHPAKRASDVAAAASAASGSCTKVDDLRQNDDTEEAY